MHILRHGQIVEYIQAHGKCTIKELADVFGTSGMTIRRDLKTLAEAGKIIRTFGGAAPAANVSMEFQFLERRSLHATEKQKIAAAAERLIEDGQSVLLDGGTTTLELARLLKTRKNLTVVTTSLPIASELHGANNITVIMLGGRLQQNSPDVIGAITEANLEHLRVDLAFLGVDGIDPQGNAYARSPEEARTLLKMASAATSVYVLADSSKAGRSALARLGHLNQWKGLVMDDAWSDETLAELRLQGVNCIKASARITNESDT